MFFLRKEKQIKKKVLSKKTGGLGFIFEKKLLFFLNPS